MLQKIILRKLRRKAYGTATKVTKLLLPLILVLIIGLQFNENTPNVNIMTDSFEDVANVVISELETIDATEVKHNSVTLDSIPEYSGDAYIYINNNVPFFTETELTTDAFETYSSLDYLGRCGVAYANICSETLPTEDRGDISSVYPSGWNQEKYEGIVDQNWLYNRCHLIAHSLAGEDANERNLITGTRYMNIEGMWQLEETVLYYIKDNPDNHVLYRVTPIFEGNNLVASGVLMEAYSVEDCGKGVCFNVYCYNVQPGVVIDYATGESWAE